MTTCVAGTCLVRTKPPQGERLILQHGKHQEIVEASCHGVLSAMFSCSCVSLCGPSSTIVYNFGGSKEHECVSSCTSACLTILVSCSNRTATLISKIALTHESRYPTLASAPLTNYRRLDSACI